MTRAEVILKAMNGDLKWIQAADILGVTPRQIRRMKRRYEGQGFGGLRDHRGGRPRRKRIPLKTIQELCRLKKETYLEFSVQHFWEFATEQHGLEISYNWARLVLQNAGLVEKAPARGKYRRKRERRPMRGMMLHMDASTHAWVEGVPKQDLNVVMDDADGRILHAQFFEQEGVHSTLKSLDHVLTRHGRFCELYTDRGRHFCQTSQAGAPPDEVQNGPVPTALRALGIRPIYARSPEARGRSERAFGTIQGRLPQELKLAGITSYNAANRYLETQFIPDFNRRFTVEPAQKESAFVPLVGIDLKLLLSVQHERTVKNDSTVVFEKTVLQLPKTEDRLHYVRCPVLVHEFLDGTLGVSYQGKLLATYTRDGELIQSKAKRRVA